ncbi:MAG: DUF2779 domain-containing protein [Firmicutes bacterium]|nr:DUF2779 domain-containing protein [Bacillota bacterium]
MAITKTNFINYSRCPRYVALDDLKKEKLDSVVTLEEYRKEEEAEYIKELLGDMYDEDNNDLIDVKNEHLEVMLPYYNKVEILAGQLSPKYFEGTFKYSAHTQAQESFDFKKNGIRYLCYVDIYNETKDAFNIIEVKATTTNKYLGIGKTVKDEFGNKKVNSIFQRGDDGIYYLLEELNVNISDYMEEDKYYTYKQKLFKKLDPSGHYVFDLAVQRYIIENDLKQNNMSDKIDKIKYYLAVCNADYVFNGKYENDEPLYETDENGNDIICYFDMTSITKDYLDIVDIERKKVEMYIQNLKIDPVPIGQYCENKKTTVCKYKKICWSHIPSYNSVFNYIDSHHGFKDENGNKYELFDLVSDGIIKMEDIPTNYLNRPKNVIQKNALVNDEPFINEKKIIDGIKQITYPIYHLDFETFPCPLPRYKGEKCYTQSVFQFSLHIEKEPNVCDKEKDHYEFLAYNHSDLREELVKKMCEYIDTKSGGTVLVYNEAFEKTRLKELANIFPEYKRELLKIREMIFDLMNITKTKSSLYENLGYDKEEAKMFNYYHKDQSGSFSIKKFLPLFSNLTYKGMEIGNGVEAMIAYATFPKLNEREFKHKYQKLVEYCKQDTWAMYEVLKGLKKKVGYHD